jgi:hypothetical protein
MLPHDGVEIATTDRKDRVRAGVGTSEADDARLAGQAAAAAAIAGLAGEAADLVVVYASVRYDLSTLLGGVRGVTGTAPLVGATTTGQFHNGTITMPGRGVAVLALTRGPYRFGIGAVTGLRTDAFRVGRDMARRARAAVGAEPSPHAALLVLADGLAGHQQEFLNGIHKVTGAAVPVVGGAAGDDLRLHETFVLAGDRVLADAAVAVWIHSPWPLSVVVRHGWQPVGLPRLVTKVDGPVLYEIDGLPAVEIFRDCRQAHHPIPPDIAACGCPCCVGTTAAGDTPRQVFHTAHALGLLEPDGSRLVRGAYVDDDGHLRTFCPLPTYSAVQVMSAQPDDLLEVTDDVVGRAVAGRDAGVLLVFSCAARMDVLDERVPEEGARLQAAAGAVPTFGFFTYGEFARTTSVAGYHNATLAAIAL